MNRSLIRTAIAFAVFFATLSGITLAQATPPFTRTVIVNAGNNALNNGTNLLASLASIPGTAGPNQPWLLKVEPGIYDLGGNQLVMRNFVDIEGSGRDVTTITSNVALLPQNAPTLRVPAGVEATLRELTVANTAAGRGIGIQIASSQAFIDRVDVEANTGGIATGIQTDGVSPRVNQVSVRASGERATGIFVNGGGTVITESLVFIASPFGSNIGISIDQGSTAFLDRTVVFTLLGNSNIGINIVRDSTPDVNNAVVTASGTTARAVSIARGSFPRIKELIASASSDSQAVALELTDSRAEVTESTLRAQPITNDHLGVFAARLNGGSTLRSNQSNYDGSAFAVQNLGTGTAFFGASQLIGTAQTAALGGLKCVHAYNGNYDPRNNFCQ